MHSILSELFLCTLSKMIRHSEYLINELLKWNITSLNISNRILFCVIFYYFPTLLKFQQSFWLQSHWKSHFKYSIHCRFLKFELNFYLKKVNRVSPLFCWDFLISSKFSIIRRDQTSTNIKTNFWVRNLPKFCRIFQMSLDVLKLLGKLYVCVQVGNNYDYQKLYMLNCNSDCHYQDIIRWKLYPYFGNKTNWLMFLLQLKFVYADIPNKCQLSTKCFKKYGRVGIM